jgi:hypothetical protein
MGIEPNELMNSLEWMNLPIEEIQDRHNLLKKTEKYATPNPKKPQISKV